VKIFRVGETDPLLWQLGYIDSEISKILQNRYQGGGTNALRRGQEEPRPRP